MIEMTFILCGLCLDFMGSHIEKVWPNRFRPDKIWLAGPAPTRGPLIRLPMENANLKAYPFGFLLANHISCIVDTRTSHIYSAKEWAYNKRSTAIIFISIPRCMLSFKVVYVNQLRPFREREEDGGHSSMQYYKLLWECSREVHICMMYCLQHLTANLNHGPQRRASKGVGRGEWCWSLEVSSRSSHFGRSHWQPCALPPMAGLSLSLSHTQLF